MRRDNSRHLRAAEASPATRCTVRSCTTLYALLTSLQDVWGDDDARVVEEATQVVLHGRAAFLHTRVRVAWPPAPSLGGGEAAWPAARLSTPPAGAR